MWEDTALYKRIMASAHKWSMKKKDYVYVEAIWVRGNGEYQTKQCNVPSGYVVEWFDTCLDAYWLPDEAEMQIVIENEYYYWQHPYIRAKITITDIEEEHKRLEEEFKKSVVYVSDHVFTFGGRHE